MKKIDYESLVRNALRDVVRNVLKSTAKDGLPGDHHFLITFLTTHPDVVCPHYLVEEHPDEMTIILQHEFFNLIAEDLYFRVTLNFNERLENLIIPYDAIVCFVDPSVKFGLHFDEIEDFEEENLEEECSTENKNNVVSLEDYKKNKSKNKN